MDSSKLNDWLQVIGLFGVIASLVFVGLQMMQDREIALSAIYQERTNASAELLLTAATDETIRSALLKLVDQNEDSLTGSEELAYDMFVSAGHRLRDNSHYQWEQGFLPDEHWAQIRTEIKNDMRIEHEREKLLALPMRPSFRAELEVIAEELVDP
jgi:hypothetical protein